MFKKKQVTQKTSAEILLEEKDRQLYELREKIEHTAWNCYIKDIAMKCYIPMEPDWNYQGERCRDEQEKLRAYIGEYDALRQEIINLMKKVGKYYNEPQDSHTVVEYGISRFMRTDYWH